MCFLLCLLSCFVHAHTFLLTSFLIGKQTFSISPARVSTYIYYIACKLQPIKKSLHYANPLFLRICMGTNMYLFHASTPHVFLVPIFVRLTYIRLCLFCTNSLKNIFYICMYYASYMQASLTETSYATRVSVPVSVRLVYVRLCNLP